ncbi:hypothetical protein FI667_g15818, partial [Globisporangium splendens]
MAERFDDWSPASVFGATSPPQTRRQASDRDQLFQRECRQRVKSEHSSDTEQGCSVHLLPVQAKRESSMHILGEEDEHDEHTDSSNPNSRYYTRQRDRSMHQEGSEYQGDVTEAAHGEHLVRPKSRIIRRNSDHRMRLDDTRDNRSTQRGSADSIASKERQFAANTIQNHARIFILRKRERDSLQQVDALRRALKEAAGQLTIQSLRRYRSRLAIRNYLCSWWEREARIQILLERIRTKKQSRAVQLASERSSRDALAHHHARCANLIWKCWMLRDESPAGSAAYALSNDADPRANTSSKDFSHLGKFSGLRIVSFADSESKLLDSCKLEARSQSSYNALSLESSGEYKTWNARVVSALPNSTSSEYSHSERRQICDADGKFSLEGPSS